MQAQISIFSSVTTLCERAMLMQKRVSMKNVEKEACAFRLQLALRYLCFPFSLWRIH